MNKKLSVLGGSVLAATALASYALSGQDDGLRRPKDLHELVFLSSGHGMAYGPARDAGGKSPPFSNVYVTPPAYRAFMKTGVWPEGATFFLEIRRAETNVSINSGGQSQGDRLAIEAEVKDSKLNAQGGWAFYNFGDGGKAEVGTLLPRSESCYGCHSKHGAVEWTFTQFYPEQFAAAKARGTVRKDYDPAAKPE